MMRIFLSLVLALSLGVPSFANAEEPVVVSDVSAGLFRFQSKLAEQGNPEAQYIVGEMYEMGTGVKENKTKALHWFEKSAAKGHKKSAYKLLFIDIQSYGLNDLNKSQLGSLRHEAATGRAEAQYFLGKMYAAGVGVPKSLNNALTWLNKATFNGIVEAEREVNAVEEELAAVKDRQASKRAAATAEAQKRKAEEARIKAAKKKEARKKEARRNEARRKEASKKEASKKRKEQNAKRKSTQNAESKKAAEHRRRVEFERKIREEEKLRLEKERKILEAEVASNAAKEKQVKKDKPAKKEKTDTSYQSDPCKGKSARFLSTCR